VKNTWKLSGESDETVKNFYGTSSLFLGVGGSFKKLPRYDRCEFFGGHVSTSTFWGWHFLPEYESFRGIRSSESTRFPEGLVLGNWAKTLHLQNVGFAEFVNKFVDHLQSGRFCFMRRKHS
jgi:hypothetical protein